MRLGLLGPCGGDLEGLGRAAEYLLDVAKVDRAIYLGDDDALDAAVVSWAMRLVGHDPTDDGAWERAGELAINGTAKEIDWFVGAQRARMRLRRLESLPSGESRTIEMIGDRVAIFLYDKALLDEEDIYAAHVLVYGKTDAPLVKRVGTRWFVTPGRLGPTSGIGVLDDEGNDVVATLYDGAGTLTATQLLTVTRGAQVRVQGGP